MLLAGVLFGLVTVGFVVPCLIDVASTAASDLRSLTKPAWVLVIVFLSAFGATAWLIAGRPHWRRRSIFPRYLEGAPSIGQQEALRRHPAGRAWDPTIDARLGNPPIRASEIPRPGGTDHAMEILPALSRRMSDSDTAT